MKQHVKRKQPNSRSCLVCGLRNPFGLKARFFEMDNGELVCLFTPEAHHQGYPGRLHGGIAAAILDEAIGRAVQVNREDTVWGVTLEFTIQYKKPIPLDRELKAVCRFTKETGRSFEGSGEILLPDGTVAASGQGRYLKLPIDKIADFNPEEADWQVVRDHQDPIEIEL